MAAQPFPDSVAELLAVADRLALGRTRLEVIQRAVQVADSLQDTVAGFQTRRRLIDEAATGLQYDLYAVAFGWCLAVARKDPMRFSLADLLGHYQLVIGKMVNFPDVSRQQYESLFADVVRELQAHGFSLRTAYLERRSVAIDFGDKRMGESADSEWRKYPHDELSSSLWFEMARQIDYELFLDDDRAAVRVVDQYFALVRRNCGYDSWVSSLSLLPLLRLGRGEEAAIRYQTAAKAVRISAYPWSWGYHLEYLAQIGDFVRGVREFEMQLATALAQSDPLSRYYCFRPALFLLDRMKANGVATVTMRAPHDVPWGDGHGVYNVAELREWIGTEATAIAAQFDKRNGNPFYSEWLRRTIEQEGWGTSQTAEFPG